MTEQRLIDANKLIEQLEGIISDYTSNGAFPNGYDINSAIDSLTDAPTIDPETLPVVRQLREELARVTAERDEIAALCGKLIALCDQPQKWRVKLFRRHQGAMIGDYMGSGYPFVDSFNRIYTEFEETASDGAYQAIRRATDCTLESEEK